MFPHLKNSYLQSKYEEINPRLINRCVQRAREFIGNDVHDLEPPFNRLTSEQPSIPVQHVDVTRRPTGFGRVAMPLLRRELHDKQLETVLAAIQSICDLAHDPERGHEAVDLKIVDRMVDLVVHEEPAIRERTTNALEIFARLSDGREAIVCNKHMLENLTICVDDEYPEIRIHVAALLEMIARFWKTADVLVSFGFVPILLSNLLEEEQEIVEIHLEALKSLMYGCGKNVAVDHDGFFIFLKLLSRVHHQQILCGACDCLTILTSTRAGEILAQEVNLLETLSKLLQDERPAVYTSAASTIMFCTVKTKAKIMASKIKKLPKRLVELCQNSLNPSTQIYAIKALTNICEHPDIRKQIKKHHYRDLQTIQLGTEPCLKHYKEILLTVVDWTPASST